MDGTEQEKKAALGFLRTLRAAGVDEQEAIYMTRAAIKRYRSTGNRRGIVDALAVDTAIQAAQDMGCRLS